MKYINVNKELIPYSFEIELSGEVFRIEVYYNERFDYFTLDLYLEDKPILFGEKLLLDSRAFSVIDYTELLRVDLTPTDIAKIEKSLTFENMNEQVFLMVGVEDE